MIIKLRTWSEFALVFSKIGHTKPTFSLQMLFQDRVMNRRQTEHERLITESAEKINHILQQRKQEIEEKRKMMFYLKSEEQRLKKLREEEEARKHEGKKKEKEGTYVGMISFFS